jgi:hypothetical protein
MEPTRSIAGKKRLGQRDVDSDCLFDVFLERAAFRSRPVEIVDSVIDPSFVRNHKIPHPRCPSITYYDRSCLSLSALSSLHKTLVVPPHAATPTFDHKNIRTISCYGLIVIVGLVNLSRGVVL